MEKGAISGLDVGVSRALFRLGLEADFSRSVEDDSRILLFADKTNSGMLIGRGGKNAKRLSIMLEKELRVIEQTDDERKLIEKIISAPILGINKIYGKSELYKVRMEKRFRQRAESLVPLVSKAIGKDVRMVFE